MTRRCPDPVLLVACAVLTLVALFAEVQMGAARAQRDEARAQLRILHVRCTLVEDGSLTCPPGSAQVDRVKR